MSREVRELTDVPEVGPLLVKGLVGSARKRGVPVDELPRLSLLLDDQPQDVARLADYYLQVLSNENKCQTQQV